MSETSSSGFVYDQDKANETLALLDDQYVQYDPQPKHLHPLFDQLRNDQLEFATKQRYKTLEQAVAAGGIYAEDINEKLEKAGKKDKRLLGMAAVLTGTNLISSSATVDFATAQLTLDPKIPQDGEEQFIAQTMGARGYFQGISYLVDMDDEMLVSDANTDTEGLYYIKLHYLVQYGVCRSPFGVLPVAALGEIGASQLAFMEDIQREKVHEALSCLLSNESEEVAILVNDLNQALSSPYLSGDEIQEVSRLVGLLHESKDLRAQDSEAVLELILAHIPTEYPYKVGSIGAVEYPVNAKGNESYILNTAEGDGLISFDDRCTDIILAPGYVVEEVVEDGAKLKKSPMVPYFVLETDDAVIHVPMDRVRSFGPGTY